MTSFPANSDNGLLPTAVTVSEFVKFKSPKKRNCWIPPATTEDSNNTPLIEFTPNSPTCTVPVSVLKTICAAHVDEEQSTTANNAIGV